MPAADEAAVHRLVTGAAAGDDPDLALHGRVGAHDEVRIVDRPGCRSPVGRLHPFQRLTDDSLGVVDELLHLPSTPQDRRSIPATYRSERDSAKRVDQTFGAASPFAGSPFLGQPALVRPLRRLHLQDVVHRGGLLTAHRPALALPEVAHLSHHFVAVRWVARRDRRPEAHLDLDPAREEASLEPLRPVLAGRHRLVRAADPDGHDVQPVLRGEHGGAGLDFPISPSRERVPSGKISRFHPSSISS